MMPPARLNPLLRISRLRGFSLLEMIVAAAIALLIFAVGFVMITGTIRARGQSISRVHATENARLFFQLLEKDLNSAYAGHPGSLMIKGVAPISAAATVPAPLVLSESNPIASDLIQFYTRADATIEAAPESPDRAVFVRYYVNQSEHTLCRDFFEDSTTPTPVALESEPFSTTHVPDSHALFEEARQIHIDYVQWFPNFKKFDLPTSNPASATHIRVQLILFDSFAEARNRGDPAVTDDSQPNIRAFSKTFPIPSGFQ